jgi:transposase
MKNKHLFIGIDIAKLTFEAAFIQSTAISSTGSKSFTNDKKGFRNLIKWIKNINLHQQEWVFCFEHTGIYAFHFCCFLEDNNLDYCYESALKINRSLGIIKRQKSDRADAIDIAKYLYQKRDDLEYYKLPSRSVQKLKALISLRRRMLKQKIGMSVSSSEIAAFSDKQTARIIKQESNKIINKFEKQIEKIDEQIVNLMNADPELSEKYNLVRSVIGIGPVISAYIIAKTNCFKNFKNGREFSSYCGSAPFERSSGTSIKKVIHLSKAADKELKSLLTNGAYAAIRYDDEIRAYFMRKIKEGKSEFCVINAIRNKLIHRVFAVVHRGTPFVKIANYSSSKN